MIYISNQVPGDPGAVLSWISLGTAVVLKWEMHQVPFLEISKLWAGRIPVHFYFLEFTDKGNVTEGERNNLFSSKTYPM